MRNPRHTDPRYSRRDRTDENATSTDHASGAVCDAASDDRVRSRRECRVTAASQEVRR
jgi:hypothetical protein